MEENKIKCLGIIPARGCSKRLPKKNIKELNGHPLIAYAICSAISSGVYDKVIVSTEDEETAKIAVLYGAEVPFMRPKEFSTDKSDDIDFIKFTLEELKKDGYEPECFSILRPTSPLRQPETIKRAWKLFLENKDADSLRAIEKCSEHPAKMWKINGNRMTPIMENPDKSATPWHSMNYQSLPETYVQNASLEIAWSKLPLEEGTIAGSEIVPFITEGYEGFDINFPIDWMVLENLIKTGEVILPRVEKA